MTQISIEFIKDRIVQPLPGMKAHLKMTPYRALTKIIPENRREGAVLILLYKKNGEYYFPLTLRHDYKGTHANQISFPGGKIEKQDATILDAALRETNEEIGVELEKIIYLGELTQIYIPPSNFLVSPFIGLYEGEPLFIKEEKEVKEIIEIPLKSILNEKNVGNTQVSIQGGMKLETPYLNLENNVVWGATAAILSELKEIIQS